MEYSQLNIEDYKNETLAKNIYGREVEYFHYEFDKHNFQHLLTVLPEGPQKENVKERLKSTIEQMNYVDSICAALKAQITNPIAYEAAVIKATNERAAEKITNG